jgi:hypothetical protein
VPNREVRLSIFESQRGPEPREATADDDDIAMLVADKRRRLRGIALALQRLVEPPRGS